MNLFLEKINSEKTVRATIKAETLLELVNHYKPKDRKYQKLDNVFMDESVTFIEVSPALLAFPEDFRANSVFVEIQSNEIFTVKVRDDYGHFWRSAQSVYMTKLNAMSEETKDTVTTLRDELANPLTQDQLANGDKSTLDILNQILGEEKTKMNVDFTTESIAITLHFNDLSKDQAEYLESHIEAFAERVSRLKNVEDTHFTSNSLEDFRVYVSVRAGNVDDRCERVVNEIERVSKSFISLSESQQE